MTVMIEVFKTNVQFKEDAKRIVSSLQKKIADSKINFDMEDCDKILRIEGTSDAKNNYILNHMKQFGYYCEILK